MRRESVGEDHVDDPRVLALSSVLVQISAALRWGERGGGGGGGGLGSARVAHAE